MLQTLKPLNGMEGLQSVQTMTGHFTPSFLMMIKTVGDEAPAFALRLAILTFLMALY